MPCACIVTVMQERLRVTIKRQHAAQAVFTVEILDARKVVATIYVHMHDSHVALERCRLSHGIVRMPRMGS